MSCEEVFVSCCSRLSEKIGKNLTVGGRPDSAETVEKRYFELDEASSRFHGMAHQNFWEVLGTNPFCVAILRSSLTVHEEVHTKGVTTSNTQTVLLSSSSITDMKVIVFGSTGPVGRTLVEILSKEQPTWEIFAVTRSSTNKFDNLKNVVILQGDAFNKEETMKLSEDKDMYTHVSALLDMR